jgi:hypothetical protein
LKCSSLLIFLARLLLFGMRDKAQKLQSLAARVLELVPLIGRHVNNIVGFEMVLLLSVEKHPFALQDEDFVLLGMRMQGTAASRGDFEEAHGEVRGTCVFGDEPAHFDVGCATFFDVFEFDGFVIENLHDFHRSHSIWYW